MHEKKTPQFGPREVYLLLSEENKEYRWINLRLKVHKWVKSDVNFSQKPPNRPNKGVFWTNSLEIANNLQLTNAVVNMLN